MKVERMEKLSNARIKEILKTYKKKSDLFNWCEEYKDWVHSGVHLCVSSEWEYMLRKSMEGDRDSPLDWEDIDFFDVDKARENLSYDYEDNKEDFNEYANDSGYPKKVKNKKNWDVYLETLNKDELKEIFNEFSFLDIGECDAEVYEWWIVSDPVMYELEKQGEIIYEHAWGRCTTGQGFDMDGCMINAYITRIKRWLK